MDLLGWGVDVTVSDRIEQFITVPMFAVDDFSDINNTYDYPLFVNHTYRYPSHVFVRTSGQVETDTYLAADLASERKTLFAELGLSYQPPPPNETTSAHFTGDADAAYNADYLSDSEHRVITHFVYNGLWQLVFDAPNADQEPHTTRAMNQLIYLVRNQLPADDAMLAFVQNYGTHYIDSVMVGGILQVKDNVQTDSTLTDDQLKVVARAAFENMFGITSGTISLIANYSENTEHFEENAAHNLRVAGGDFSVAQFFAGNSLTKEDLENWIYFLPSNPVAIKVRLRDISEIFSYVAPDVADVLQPVVDQYLAGTLPHITNTFFEIGSP